MPNATLKVAFLLKADKTREDSTLWRIFSMLSTSMPLREASWQSSRSVSLPLGSQRRQLTWMATIVIPVSRTSVLEKKDTSTPATNPIVFSQYFTCLSVSYIFNLPARLPPDICLMTSGLNHSLDSSTARDATGAGDRDTGLGRGSRRYGFWRLMRNAPVERLSPRGRAWRRSAPRHRAIVAMAVDLFEIRWVSVWVSCPNALTGTLNGRHSQVLAGTMQIPLLHLV